MSKNILVINVDIRETRVALIESGIIAELHVERASTRGTLGNICLGKVTRVLPGMQAAFIDVGLERAAFLHVEDLIRPDDFEAFLAGHKREDNEVAPSTDDSEEPREPPRGRDGGIAAKPERLEEPAAVAEPSSEPGEPHEAQREASEPDDEEEEEVLVEASVSASEGALAAEAGEDSDDDIDESDASAEDDEGLESDAGEDAGLGASDGAIEAAPAIGEANGRVHESAYDAEEEEDEEELAAEEASLAVAVSTVGIGSEGVGAQPPEPAPAPPAARREGAESFRDEGRGGRSGGQQGGRGQHGGGRQGGAPTGNRAAQSGRGSDSRAPRARRLGRHGQPQQGNKQRQGQGRNGGRPGRDSVRLSRSTPIRDVVREGQEVIVQVSKEPIGTKGARVTSHISLPGRYVVYMPTIDQIGISKRIGSEKERARLREAIESMKPPSGGLIVRTVAEGLTKKQLKADVGYLVRLWGEIAKKHETTGKAPSLLYQELDLVLKTARDLFTDEIDQIVIDDREQYHRLVRFVEAFMPERVKDVILYSGDEPIFDAYGLEDEIARALSRKVPLPSGGYLIIDQAEALTAIDVNTGRFVGKGSKDLEDTLFKTNLEAVEEIAYQLRFRNLGGLIVLDLIDMEKASNREKIYRRLEELLLKDKAKTTLNRISDLGLIEMTRKRTRESLGRLLHEQCFYCDGTGQLQSKQTVAYEILRQIRRDRSSLPGYSVVVNAHPAVIDLMKGEEKEAVQEAERRFMRRIELVPRKEYHLEQFDLAGK